ncbi:quaternary ammonium compound-resistance protein SugE [Actinopolymorpha cephalotaxi]|uniref:Quaternary ammonium compound-resistance protein SugE n=1 Tax=Actinopolymorpha cephalotaxi TaxID=504797 RepID=A0A1I2NKM3_9ACTN|nr:multidrug efflux SMR transporter [Actinopolymorpha cephalotaxi]NYH85496.1 quaternary ammonium compound-resistance protein SugE [Actinopolymorpha cephalotaxi]SFG03560.1 quaternary ammonium compound-resistance protein SugE [Actinopolymorpha cephalotaxi]
MAWLVLVGSGFLEAGWAISLKLSNGFTRLVPSVVFAVCAVASLGGLAWAMKQIPVGPAYAAWTGIGASATAVIGMVFLGDGFSVLKLVSLVLIIAGVVGLNLSGAGH